MVHLDRGPGTADEAAVLRGAVYEFFARRVTEARRRLRELFHRGRLSLLIAIAFLALALMIGERVASYFPESRLALLVQEGVLIVGWVAMWRPVEIFLYDWWPIRTDIRLLERLSSMPVRIEYRDAAPADAWRTRLAGGACRGSAHVRRWAGPPFAIMARHRRHVSDRVAAAPRGQKSHLWFCGVARRLFD